MATQNSTRRGNRFIDLTGQKFGRWTVIELYSIATGSPTMWLCRCECGTKRPIQAGALSRGGSRSCRRCAMQRHRKVGTPEYFSWGGMLSRCRNTNSPSYPRYGGRGITACQRWIDSFEDFLEDMGTKPSLQHSIDRIDNDGNYSCGHCPECLRNGWPANCRWATRTQQARNSSRNRLLTHNGQTMCLAAWAKLFGIHWGTLRSRLVKGVPMEMALTTPVKSRKRKEG